MKKHILRKALTFTKRWGRENRHNIKSWPYIISGPQTVHKRNKTECRVIKITKEGMIISCVETWEDMSSECWRVVRWV